MRLSIPTNWDLGLLWYLESHRDLSVTEIYASLDKTLIGGGRSDWCLPVITKKHAQRFISKVRELGIKFSYLLNSPCAGGLEYTPSGKKHLIKQLDWLEKSGVDSVVVSIPFLVEFIKKKFRRMKITVSVIAHVNSVERARFFEELGADTITVDFMENRNFRLLKALKEAVKCEIQLLLNDICLYGCPFRFYHYNLMGHCSQENFKIKNRRADFYCLLKCTLLRYSRPEELLRSRWIRPEDLNVYERIGIDLFKISGRTESTSWIINAMQAYSNRQYAGNLLDLLTSFETPKYNFNYLKRKSFLSEFLEYLPIGRHRNFYKFGLNLPSGSLKNLVQLYIQARGIKNHVFIDNKALNNFINFFLEEKTFCQEYNYCKSLAKDVIKINNSALAGYLTTIQKNLENLI